MDSAPYLLGRAEALLAAPYAGADLLYVAQRLDDRELENPSFEHCTFANVSFKKATITHARFLNCTFVGCYFHRARLSSCEFMGCRFIDCNFNQLGVSSCSFKYTRFSRCFIPFEELQHSLPSEPNLRRDLARNLTIEAANLGDISVRPLWYALF